MLLWSKGDGGGLDGSGRDDQGQTLGGGGGGVVAKSCPTLATPWTVARQASLSMGFSRQEYWSGLPFPSPGDLPDSGIKPGSPAVQADSLLTELQGKPPDSGYFFLIEVQLIYGFFLFLFLRWNSAGLDWM